MKKISYLVPILLMAFVFSMIVSSCAELPDEEIMMAEDAIKDAINAEAEDLSPKLLFKAQSLLQEAKMLNEQGKYAEAKKKALYAKLKAESSKKNADRLNEVHRKKDEGEYEGGAETED